MIAGRWTVVAGVATGDGPITCTRADRVSLGVTVRQPATAARALVPLDEAKAGGLRRNRAGARAGRKPAALNEGRAVPPPASRERACHGSR
jgi:hypothetical protein